MKKDLNSLRIALLGKIQQTYIKPRKFKYNIN